MGTQHKVTFTQEMTRMFNCAHCGTAAIATYRAKGDGGWVREGLFDDGSEARERSTQSAAADLTTDADRVHALLRCPVCNQRRANALRTTYLAAFVPPLAAFAAFVVFDDPRMKLVCPLAILFLGLGVLFREIGRISRARNAVLALVSRGKAIPRAAKPRPSPTVPVVRPVVAPAPVVPVRTSAPEITQPRGPDEGPAFLKGD